MKVHVLHLSDVHARPERDADLRIVLTALHGCLTDILSRTGWPIDFVCFTGDLVQKGIPEEYEYARELFIDPLLELLHLGKEGLFIAPGNHDVKRVVDGPEKDQEDRLLASLTTREAVNRLLDSPEGRDQAFARLTAYKTFVRDYLSCIPASEDPLYACVRPIQIRGSAFTVASINSAWRCNSDQDFKRLLVGERQVDCAGAKTRNGGLRISLVHHPFSWLCDFDERDCSRRMFAESDLILSGHVHDPLPQVLATPFGRCLVSCAGAVFDGRTFNGFSIIEIDTESLEGTVFLFRYYDDRRAFDKDLFIVADGVFPFSLARLSDARADQQRATGLRPEDAAVIRDDAQKRERVTTALSSIRQLVGGPWILGISLGLVSYSPPRTSGAGAVAENLVELSASDETVADLVRNLAAIGHALRESDDDVSSIVSRLVQLLGVAKQLWPEDIHGAFFERFDRVVQTLVQPDSSAQDVLPAKLLAIDELLQEQRYDPAIERLRTLNTYDPQVRSRLVDALHATERYDDIIGVVTSAPRESLGQVEIENCIWSYCELGKFPAALAWFRDHERYQTTSARVFRLAVLGRFSELGRVAEEPRGDA